MSIQARTKKLDTHAYSFGFECLNSLDLNIRVALNRFEVLEKLLSLINNSLILENRTVLGEIDSGRLGGILAMQALGIAMALPEGL